MSCCWAEFQKCPGKNDGFPPKKKTQHKDLLDLREFLEISPSSVKWPFWDGFFSQKFAQWIRSWKRSHIPLQNGTFESMFFRLSRFDGIWIWYIIIYVCSAWRVPVQLFSPHPFQLPVKKVPHALHLCLEQRPLKPSSPGKKIGENLKPKTRVESLRVEGTAFAMPGTPCSQPFINVLAINWMIPNLYIGNGWKSPNIHL